MLHRTELYIWTIIQNYGDEDDIEAAAQTCMFFEVKKNPFSLTHISIIIVVIVGCRRLANMKALSRAWKR